MVKTDFKTVAAYIAAQPKAAQKVLRQVRAAIRKALPGADETISYQIPTYKLNGRAVLYFAGWARHYSVYPATAGVLATFKAQLVMYEVAKGTIRFPLEGPVPTKLIADIAKLRAHEQQAVARKKPVGRKKR